MRFGGGILSVIAILSFVGCGEDGSTTIIDRTVTMPPTTTDQGGSTYLPGVATTRKFVEPTLYSFSVDGDLVGKELTWRDWGSSIATARGTIEERNLSPEHSDETRSYRGSVVASGLEACGDSAYYSEVIAKVPSGALFVPEEATDLDTPCGGTSEDAPSSAPSQRALPPKTFATPSGNIVCDLSAERIRCDIADKNWTPHIAKPPSCQLDWGNSIGLGAHGPSEFLCAGDTLLGSANAELGYGDEISRGRIRCISQETGLTCRTAGGTGFYLSIERVKLF